MDYEDFKERLLAELNVKKPDYVDEFVLVKAQKDNRNALDAITIKYGDNRNVCPTLYVRDFFKDYQNGWGMDEVVERVIRLAGEEQTKQHHFRQEDLTRENAKKCLTLRLINKEWNRDMINRCAHLELETEDLIAVPRWDVPMGEYTGSFLVTYGIQRNLLHMTDEELLSIARKNTLEQSEFMFRSLKEILGEMQPEYFETELYNVLFRGQQKESLYALTNKGISYGAVALLSKDILSGVRSRIGEDFYIIPSSVHEVLIIPESDWDDPAELRQMCQEVNAAFVDETDRLGDNIYRFDGRQLKICNSMEEAIFQRGDSAEMDQEQQMSPMQGMVL